MSRAFLDHVGRHRSDLEGSNPRLLLLEQMEEVLGEAQRREARAASLAELSAALRGGVPPVPPQLLPQPPQLPPPQAAPPPPIVAQFRLEEPWRQLFDAATGSAVNLPLIDDSLHARLLQPRALGALAALPADTHARLSDALHGQYIGGSSGGGAGGGGRPPLSQADLTAFFTVFSAEELRTAAAAAAEAANAATLALAAQPMGPLPEGRAALARETALFDMFFDDDARRSWGRACDVAGDERFSTVAAPRFAARLRGLSWPTYAHSGGNPFNFKITKESVARGPIANYFSLVRAPPMDAVRITESAAKGSKGPYKGGEKGVEALAGDMAAMANNALSYYGPPACADPLTLRTEGFTAPDALEPRFTAAAGGIYGMAWQVKELVGPWKAHAAAALTHFRRVAKRELCASPQALPPELAAGISWYVRPAFQEALRAASRAQAVEEGWVDLVE